jgi:hypothetical protein
MTTVGVPGVRCKTPPTAWYIAVAALNRPAAASPSHAHSRSRKPGMPPQGSHSRAGSR